MATFYKADYQVFAGNDVISITLTPIDSDEVSSYEIECPIDRETVQTILSMLCLTFDSEKNKPIEDVLVNNLLNVVNTPIELEGNSQEILVIEKVTLRKPTIFNGKLVEKGSKVTIKHRGRIITNY